MTPRTVCTGLLWLVLGACLMAWLVIMVAVCPCQP